MKESGNCSCCWNCGPCIFRKNQGLALEKGHHANSSLKIKMPFHHAQLLLKLGNLLELKFQIWSFYQQY